MNRTPRRPRRRPRTSPHLAQLACGLHVQPDVAPYVDLLASAIADLRLTPDERSELHQLATELGLDDHYIAGHAENS